MARKKPERKQLRITFGDRIRRVRIAEGLTQAEFAEKCGFSEGSVATWERHPRVQGLSGPALKIAETFGYDVIDLLYGSDQQVRDSACIDELAGQAA